MKLPTSTKANHEGLSYRIPDGVESIIDDGRIQLTTPSGGRIWVDRIVHGLWKAANQRKASEIVSDLNYRKWKTPYILGGLACLAEAGLLERTDTHSSLEPETRIKGELVSIILVSFNSRPWLESCLESIANQNYTPIETIIVDNASRDGSADWINQHAPSTRLRSLQNTCSLAEAINLGIKEARGRYFLLLNPDVRLEVNAVARLVEVAKSDPNCAAVGAKLHLLWAPSFLNGLGNLVGPFAWGTDIALGHLDLGQFDRWREIPSACFAAALIPRDMLTSIGMLDEGFLMYYEDSEWCYRARLLGHVVQAAPQSKCLHAFSSQTPSSEPQGLNPTKLRRVTYGRLRFITLINSPFNWLRFILAYLLEDGLRSLVYMARGRYRMILALFNGWKDFLAALPEIRPIRRKIQSQRRLSDRELYRLQKAAPTPLIQEGIPVLTWDVICNVYTPLIVSGMTHQLPEFSGFENTKAIQICKPNPFWKRVYQIWKIEGAARLLHRTARQVQWWLMKL